MDDVETALEQREAFEAFESDGDGPWTVLYVSRTDENPSVLQWCMLAPSSLRSQVLSEVNRLPSNDFGAPGFVGSYTDEGAKYFRYGDDEGFEPLVILQDHSGVLPRMQPQLSEEFRLYHNLWANEAGTEFFKVNADGSDERVAEVGPKRVRVRTRLLRQFQAAKQLDLVLRISSHQYVDDPAEEAYVGEIAVATDRDDVCLSLHAMRTIPGNRLCSVLAGTKVLQAPAMHNAGIWPFDEEEETYHDFLIGEDDDGQPVKHTCDPDQLANYFGANPDAPHYLTPVYFRREVLQRYYERPEKYSISDGYVSCGGLWGLQLDNDHPDHVMVFLGDLGHDLPESERTFWQTFNVVPTGAPSETLVRRAFLAQWAEPGSPDLRFKSAYDRFNRKWQERCGWALFKDPEPDDVHVLQRLRTPLNDSQPEFEDQVMGLAKVMVDALNERALQQRLPTKVRDEKSISKLERWMGQEQYPSAERDIAFLRRLQRLRSKLTAHRKGSDYAQVLAEENVNDDPMQEVATMFQDAEHLLHDLAAHGGIDLGSY